MFRLGEISVKSTDVNTIETPLVFRTSFQSRPECTFTFLKYRESEAKTFSGSLTVK